MTEQLIHFVNRTKKPVNIQFRDGSEVEIGVTGQSEDDGLFSMADNGFFENNLDAFKAPMQAAIMQVTEEEAQRIKQASYEAKQTTAAAKAPAPTLKRVIASAKPQLITRNEVVGANKEAAIVKPTDASIAADIKTNNMNHFQKQLNELESYKIDDRGVPRG